MDSIAASDNLTEMAAALTSLGVNLSRFTHDMLFRATAGKRRHTHRRQFHPDQSIMPQKRNPVVPNTCARISRMLSQAQGVVLHATTSRSATRRTSKTKSSAALRKPRDFCSRSGALYGRCE
ncbi:MAG: hypothetical protein IPM16_19200 [Chloroflexi bacterium]|nr:hypothetical protein [Chloroflexota bacterium]